MQTIIRSAMLACIASAAPVDAFSASGAQEPLLIGDRRQLLFDGKFVQQAKSIEFQVHPPRKTEEMILSSEPSGGLGGYHSVLYEAGRYHMWYTLADCIHYARSDDGVHWEKPNLNLLAGDSAREVDEAGNVVLGRGLGGVSGGTHGLMVFIDPTAPRDEKFRLVCNPPEVKWRIQVFSSSDGIHWKLTHPDAICYRDAKHHLDSQNVIFWDERIGKYVAYFRRNFWETGSQLRTVARAESLDLAHFPLAEDSPVVMRADAQHMGHVNPLSKTRVDVLDTYTNGTVKYPYADDAYFMFPTEYYHYGKRLWEFRTESPYNAGALDTRFAASRDGVHWERYDYRSFVGLGMKGEFDSGRVYMVYGVTPAPNGREMYMYYLGTSETHGWDRDDNNNRLLTAAGLAPTGPSAISRVVLRRDGFVSARAPHTGGEFTTPLLQFKGDQLLLNVDTSASGELRVEILDEQGKPIAGYSLEDCDIVHTANEVNRVVKWKGESSVSRLAGTPVRLRFVMRDVDLYAFQFADRGGI